MLIPEHEILAEDINTRHFVEGLASDLTIEIVDDPSPAGANHRYDITGFSTLKNPSKISKDGRLQAFDTTVILFQNGTVPEVGANGVTMEVLLAVIEHRLQGFQAGPFACVENQEALEGVTQALEALKGRTAARIARQVEGEHVV